MAQLASWLAIDAHVIVEAGDQACAFRRQCKSAASVMTNGDTVNKNNSIALAW